MKFKDFLRAIFIVKDPEPREFKEHTIEEYEKMPMSEILSLRYDNRLPVEELGKILKVLQMRHPEATLGVRNYQ